jgi:hypothetical protein
MSEIAIREYNIPDNHQNPESLKAVTQGHAKVFIANDYRNRNESNSNHEPE